MNIFKLKIKLDNYVLKILNNICKFLIKKQLYFSINMV